MAVGDSRNAARKEGKERNGRATDDHRKWCGVVSRCPLWERPLLSRAFARDRQRSGEEGKSGAWGSAVWKRLECVLDERGERGREAAAAAEEEWDRKESDAVDLWRTLSDEKEAASGGAESTGPLPSSSAMGNKGPPLPLPLLPLCLSFPFASPFTGERHPIDGSPTAPAAARETPPTERVVSLCGTR